MTAAGTRIKLAYFVAPSQHFAGIERVVHEIASGLASQHPHLLDVHVIFSSRYDEEVLQDVPYTMHMLNAGQLRNLGKALRRCVAENQFELLVAPQVEASVIAWLAIRGLRGTTLIPHLHGNPRLEEDEGTRRTKAAYKVFRALVARNVPMILAVSPSLRDYAATSLAPRTNVVFACNPTRELPAGQWQPSVDGRFRFVSVARLSRQKGQDVLLQALALARPTLPPVTLTLVGDGPEEEALRRLSTELGLDDIVTFAGYSSDPVQYLSSADCFVLASRWEGFGVALIEALQCGLPLLATRCDFGPADIIVDDSLGTLVAPNDAAALAGGLRQAVEWSRTQDLVDLRRAAARAYDRENATSVHFSIVRSLARRS